MKVWEILIKESFRSDICKAIIRNSKGMITPFYVHPGYSGSLLEAFGVALNELEKQAKVMDWKLMGEFNGRNEHCGPWKRFLILTEPILKPIDPINDIVE